MTRSTIASLQCDVCDASLESERLSLAELVDSAEARGWVHRDLNDYCPRCTPSRRPVR